MRWLCTGTWDKSWEKTSTIFPSTFWVILLRIVAAYQEDVCHKAAIQPTNFAIASTPDNSKESVPIIAESHREICMSKRVIEYAAYRVALVYAALLPA
jgi:hypothetical protein